MKIKKFRIKNYKSIIDSGDCWLEDNLTIFAGKNESGKTSILEALEDFDVECTLLENVIPLKDAKAIPEISITFSISTDEINGYYESINTARNISDSKERTITIIKTYPDNYSVTDESIELLALNKNNDGQELSPAILERWEQIYNLIPNFILFRSFEDAIPSQVSFNELKTNGFINDLERITGYDISVLMGGDYNKIIKQKKTINIEFNTEYAQYWTQDKTSFVFDCQDKVFIIRIEEGEELYEPNQRSQGKQWHIAFYMRVSARSSEDKANVLLIDEPGLFLHASAQRDIYKRLLDSSAKSQILFTTHSPYLINSQDLHLIRLVSKDNINIGTEISNKVHAKADKETLTPILTAIGLELNGGIQHFHLVNNVVVEGQSDVFYLNAFKGIFKEETFHFIFGGGSSNMGSIGTILSGWGCNVIYLYDKDQGMRDGQKILKKNWHVKKEFIASISESSGTIEDLFSKEDFKKFILENEELTYEESNSDYIKVCKSDKVLLSKIFLTSVSKYQVELSQVTIDNFRQVFEKLQNKFTHFHELTD